MSFECPRQWEAMEPTEDPRQRRCASCERTVYWCHDAIEAGLRADQGECIAVPAWLVRGVREEEIAHRARLIIGMPMMTRTSAHIKAVTAARRALDEDLGEDQNT